MNSGKESGKRELVDMVSKTLFWSKNGNAIYSTNLQGLPKKRIGLLKRR